MNSFRTTDFSFIERESSAVHSPARPTTAREDTFAEFMRSALILDKATLVGPVEDLDFSNLVNSQLDVVAEQA